MRPTPCPLRAQHPSGRAPTEETADGHTARNAARSDPPGRDRECVGTTIEFYDFFIYGTAAALVFPTVFFPALGPAAGTVASAGLGYNLAGVLGGAIPPLLAPGLAASFGSIAIGVMLSLTGVLSLVCTFALHATLGQSLEHEREPDDSVPA